jgi:cytochrome c553
LINQSFDGIKSTMLHFSKPRIVKLLYYTILAALSISTLNAVEINALTSAETNHIRTLAASCAACHGTNGNSAGTTPVLAGLDATYFSEQMIAFKNNTRDSTVMHHHAQGLNIDEIYKLAIFFHQQKRITSNSLKPQRLEAGRD